MTPEQAARRWRQSRVAQSRRDVELETFPSTGGARSKNASPMYEQPDPQPVTVRYPGLVVEPPAPNLTSWGTWSPAAIEHVGGGYHLAACRLISQDAGWWDPAAEDYLRWAIAVWLIRPNGTISDPWVSEGNTARPYTQGPYSGDAIWAPPYGEPTSISQPRLVRWQEGALLHFTSFVLDRQYVDDTAGFWPQYVDTDLDVPYGAAVYRWVGHDGVDPVPGPALELYAGDDADFPLAGDWNFGPGEETLHDDMTVEGFEVIGPSADPNIVLYGLADNSGSHRAWLIDKNPADNTLSLAQRTTLTTNIDPDIRLGNPGGLTRISADRWVAMSSLANAAGTGMWAGLFDAKTGTVIDTLQWDDGGPYTDCYFLDVTSAYQAGNHLHFDGQGVFTAWWAYLVDTAEIEHRYTTLTASGDVLTAGAVEGWATQPWSFGADQSQRWVETCQGCLRLVWSQALRQQALFEYRRPKAGPADLPSPEYTPASGVYDDQRAVPTSHPAGYMWASNVAIGDTWDGSSPIRPKLVRYPS